MTTKPKSLAQIAPNLHPLHPSALACLASMARRFGQNERSIFSFLQSLEPGGFQRFAHDCVYAVDGWYRLDDLFDYLAGRGDLRFRAPERERRWQLALDAVATAQLGEPDHFRVLKALSVLAVLEPVAGLGTDPETLAWCLDMEPDAVAASLSALAAAGLVHRRPSRSNYGLWSSSSVDLEHWFEEARRNVADVVSLEQLDGLVSSAKPIVAHRHYHRTGTLRSFAVTTGAAQRPQGETDGTIHVVPVRPGEDFGAVMEDVADASRAAGVLHSTGRHASVRSSGLAGRSLAAEKTDPCFL